jgi:hypothetical protein
VRVAFDEAQCGGSDDKITQIGLWQVNAAEFRRYGKVKRRFAQGYLCQCPLEPLDKRSVDPKPFTAEQVMSFPNRYWGKVKLILWFAQFPLHCTAYFVGLEQCPQPDVRV